MAGAVGCLSPTVEFVSPLTDRFRFRGREQVGVVLAAAFCTISEIRYHTELGDGDVRALFYRGRIAGQHLEEAQLLGLGADGLIRELTLFGGPLPALTALMSVLGPQVAKRQGRPALATLVRLSTGPLHAMTRLGDRRIVPLADPNQS